MTVILTARIAHAINESDERLRRAFMELPDEKMAEIAEEIEKRVEEALLRGSGEAIGLCGREL